MDNNDKNKSINKFDNEYRTFASNSFYLLLNQYSSFIYLILVSFLMARLISLEIWNLIILGTSYIMIIAIISYFLPPALEYSLMYYIPKYNTLNQKKKLKSFIKKALYFKILVIVIIFILSIFLLQFIVKIININLEKEFNLILSILSPLILIHGLIMYA